MLTVYRCASSSCATCDFVSKTTKGSCTSCVSFYEVENESCGRTPVSILSLALSVVGNVFLGVSIICILVSALLGKGVWAGVYSISIVQLVFVLLAWDFVPTSPVIDYLRSLKWVLGDFRFLRSFNPIWTEQPEEAALDYMTHLDYSSDLWRVEDGFLLFLVIFGIFFVSSLILLAFPKIRKHLNHLKLLAIFFELTSLHLSLVAYS